MPSASETEKGLDVEKKIDSQDEKEKKKPTVEQRLEETEFMMQQLEKAGVSNHEGIEKEGIALESEFKDKLEYLKSMIGDENISKESEGKIHQNIVDEVLALREHVLEKYQYLAKMKEKLSKLPGEAVFEVAKEARTIKDFRDKLVSANREGDSSNEELKDAEKNLSDIMTGHEQYGVEERLPNASADTVGITEMKSSGGGDVTISSEHLAEVGTEQGKIEVNKTLKHEQIHSEQIPLTNYKKETAVVDPTNNREMTGVEVLEGGAVYGTKDLGGYEEKGDEYKQGLGFYKRNDASMIDKHVKKSGEHAGDRVHLQAELAKQADIKDKDELEKLAEKAGFTDEEKKDFLKQMGIEVGDGETE